MAKAPPVSEPVTKFTAQTSSQVKPARQPLPEHLPREVKTYSPQEQVCACGGRLRPLGQDVSELLEWVPGSFKVMRYVRPKLSCASCERIVQAPAPRRPIGAGLAGPGLLAHVLVAKYCDHQPLYRQAEMYAREDVELERSTLADWVGGCSRLLEPLVETLHRHVMNASKLHADDTRRFRCWHPATARPSWVVCGLMFAMIARQATASRQRCGLPTRRIGVASIHVNICGGSAAPCRRMRMQGSIISMKADRSRKRPAGPTCGASSTTCKWRMLRRWPPRR